jgi:hypothetical protein
MNFKGGSSMYRSIQALIAASAVMAVGFSGCNSDDFSNNANNSSSGYAAGQQAPASASMNIYDQNNNLVYSSSSNQPAVQMVAGQAYNVQVSSSNIPAGSKLMLVATDTSLPAQPQIVTQLQNGNNSVPFVAGTDAVSLEIVSSANVVTNAKAATLNVVCSSSNFTASSLNPSAISVSSSANNVYTYNASGVTANANGVGPYFCAYDFTGVGIIDTPFTNCSDPVTGYSNYVGTRDVYVMVMDSCANNQQTYPISNSVNLAATTPALGAGNVFIQGQVSAASGSAKSDVRINNVSYLATNEPNNNIVIPNFNPNSSGQYDGSFTISAMENYGQASSVNFGMTINVTDLGGLNMSSSSNVGSVDTSKAQISISYSTDENGDQDPAVSMSSTKCTGSVQAKTLLVAGSPCASGLSGDNTTGTVEVYGSYNCTVTDSGGSATIAGEFDGLTKIADSCSGGGGGGGGVPITGF